MSHDAYQLKVNLAEMLKGGVILDVTNAEQARIAEDAGAAAVMALERVPADIRREGGVARVEVRDRGIGIPPDQLERIFERFERAVSSRSYGGLGLGLYLARRAAEAHGGRVWAQVRAGGGATFSLELPLESAEVHP
jgi:signal transduction histidine kinase